MDILLLKKIKNLGDVGARVSVKSGYARNFLFPKQHAVPSTEENLAIVEQKKQELLKIEEDLKDAALIEKDKYNDYVMSFEVNVQEEDDKLFGSINLQNIVDRLTNDGFKVERKQVNLPLGPIKTFGDKNIVSINLHSDVSVTIPIKLVKNTEQSTEKPQE
jgi:large subunit ribosomal protein L9